MLKLVEEHGTRYWALIGAKLNGRTGKQVRAMLFFSVRSPAIDVQRDVRNLKICTACAD